MSPLPRPNLYSHTVTTPKVDHSQLHLLAQRWVEQRPSLRIWRYSIRKPSSNLKAVTRQTPTAAMTTIKRHHSLLHRRHSNRSKEHIEQGPNIFEGTDAVTAHKKVAVSRVVEAYDALRAENRSNSPTAEQSTPEDPFAFESLVVSLPNGEVRTFKYFLRKWDHKQYPDPEFEEAVSSWRLQFEEAATKHFFRRIALWNESEEIMLAAKQQKAMDLKNGRRRDRATSISKMWSRERGRPSDHPSSVRDELKQVTTREGLAQLLWTLLNDQTQPLCPELYEVCKEAVKAKYSIHTVRGTG